MHEGGFRACSRSASPDYPSQASRRESRMDIFSKPMHSSRSLSGMMRGLAGLLSACALAWTAAGAAPAITDEANVLPSEVAARLEQEMASLRQAAGCQVMLATTTFVSGKTLNDHAAEEAKRLLPEGPGLLVAYDRASDSIALAPSPELWRRYPAPGIVEALREATSIMRAQPDDPAAKRLAAAVRALMQRIGRLHRTAERQNRLLIPGRERALVLVFTAGLCLAAAAVFAAVMWLWRKEAASSMRDFFPEQDVPMRFGAVCSGGAGAEIEFTRL
jgi:hypothetical protein